MDLLYIFAVWIDFLVVSIKLLNLKLLYLNQASRHSCCGSLRTMGISLDPTILPPPFPDHTQLPESDGTFVKNFQEHPQCILLTDSLETTLQTLHPDGQYAIGQDSGIYWRETDPTERGAEAPDWFYVPNVLPLLDGQIRRSYVIWREYSVPLIAIELASGNGHNSNRKNDWLLICDRKESIPI